MVCKTMYSSSILLGTSAAKRRFLYGYLRFLFFRNLIEKKYAYMTEKEKMLAGELYNAADPDLLKELGRGRDLVFRFNSIPPSDAASRETVLNALFGRKGKNCTIIPPFYCDYGFNIEVGDNFFANYSVTILDEAKVRIGDNVFIAPNVGIYTAGHPLDPEERNRQREYARPVTIGNNVWIGGNVTIVPGVTIGDNVTVGAGSVVVRDIPSNCLAAGNPCRVIRYL